MVRKGFTHRCAPFSREPATIISRTVSFFRPVFGIAIIMFGCFTFSSCHVIIKLIKDVDPFHFGLVRAATFMVMAAPIVAAFKKNPFPKGTQDCCPYIQVMIRGKALIIFRA